MRKIFAFISVTVDGYYADPDGDIDWQNLDEEFDAFSIEQLDEVDTLIFGAITYEGMAAYWPTQLGRDYHPGIAERMNSIAKIVVSRTLDQAEWANTRLISSNVESELRTVKARPGKDIAIFGSSTLTASLMRMGIVDELRLLVNPVVLGTGMRLFRDATRSQLELTRTRTFMNGNVLLSYRTAHRGRGDGSAT